MKMTTHMGVVRMRDRMLAPGAELLISMVFDELTGADAQPEPFAQAAAT